MFLSLPNGFKMPSVGLGTSGFADESQLEATIETALEVGYRHFDTAFIYQNEKTVGRTLRRWLDSGRVKREDLFVTTKLPSHGVHPDRVEGFMKKSLSNLQLDYVDLYLIHFPIGMVERGGITDVLFEPKTDHAAVWKKMEEQVEAGRARHIGLSNYDAAQIETVLRSATIKPVNLQVEVHVFLQQRHLVDFCRRNDITVVAFSPLGSPGYNERMARFSEKFKEQPLPDMLGHPTISRIARKHSKSTAQVMLRFLVQTGIGVIPKSATPRRIRDNFHIFDFSLDDDDMATLAALEVGEEARISNFQWFSGIEKHPDYPFKNHIESTNKL